MIKITRKLKLKYSKSHVRMVAFDLFEELFVLLDKLCSLGLFQKNNTGGFFGFGCNAQFKSASDENVGNTQIFAHDGDVADDINWTDIGGNNAESSGSLLNGLNDILDSSFELFVLVQMSDQLEEL